MPPISGCRHSRSSERPQPTLIRIMNNYSLYVFCRTVALFQAALLYVQSLILGPTPRAWESFGRGGDTIVPSEIIFVRSKGSLILEMSGLDVDD